MPSIHGSPRSRLVNSHRRTPLHTLFVAVVTTLLGTACASNEAETADEWTPLFNGENLTGWTLKITGQELGEDPWNTFRIEDGLLTVNYENYDTFDNRFGHLFYEEPYSHYELQVEYRFLDPQVPGAPDWAFKNSGIMFHSQSPETMLTDQQFPISLEAQLLGGNGTDERPTANLCTPGTHVEIDGALVEQHCITSSAPTIHTDEWVTLDLLVLGDSLIAHIMDGDTVMMYTRPVIGGADSAELAAAGLEDGQAVTGGYIALQSESHPIQFRQVLIRRLPTQRR
ncbi:MAG: DUF1080 domain-containing protein [Gemmatimonadota bacterium]|nr:MAG: DUF1080 domain-containing protein [Gemmatimonadota bacterium]